MPKSLLKNKFKTGTDKDSVRELGSGIFWQYEGMEVDIPDDCYTEVIAGCEWTWTSTGFRGDLSITNSGTKTIPVFDVRLKFQLVTTAAFDRIFFSSLNMTGRTGLRPAEKENSSAGFMAWITSDEDAAVIAGFLDHSVAQTRVDAVQLDAGVWQVTATIIREGTPLAVGSTLELSPFRIQSGPGLSSLLTQYAEQVADIMGRRKTKPAESGWCSWYHFYGKETFDDVAACAKELAVSPLAASLRTIQIDDGWNREASGNLPDAWGDWEAHTDKFPSGMAAAARQIHDLGFRAGLWLAPFAISRKSRFFVEHPDWLVQQRNPDTGKMAPASSDHPDIFQLDCTHPGALAWLKTTFCRVFNEWGFDYVKIDFLHHGARAGGIRFNSSATSVEAYRRGLRAINEVAGDNKFILACGSPLLASVGLADGMRIGPDVGGRWLFDFGWPDWPAGNCSVRAAAIPAVWSQWMHNRWWQNDPDCLVVRSNPSVYERDFFGRLEKDLAGKKPKFPATPLGLSLEEAGLWTRLVWLSGGMMFLSEVWGLLSAEQQALLMKGFHPHGRKVSILDWYRLPDIAVLTTEGAPLLVGIFNFGEAACGLEIPATRLRLSERWNLREYWSGETFEGAGENVMFPELPPHAGRIWEVVA